MKLPLITAALMAASAMVATAAPVALTVNVGKPGAAVQPTMYGLFFEDINYAADGGLYAEMVKNRSFEFPQHLAGWTASGNVELRADGPFEKNPHYVRLSSAGHAHKHTGLENEGFFGVSVKADSTYVCSFWARTVTKADVKLTVEISDPASAGESQALARRGVTVSGQEWKKYTVSLTPKVGVDQGRLRIFLNKPDVAAVDLEHISLFPKATFRGDANGLRQDLAQALADLHPGVFRFPGGCIVEGTSIKDRYQWKNTVGPVENRPTIENRWHYTFTHRFYPDYYQSNGLGFYEYFRLAEQIGAAPLPVLNVGMACQYQNNNIHAHAPLDSLQPYIQDALDLIEFANGDTLTEWGGLRARMGHPAPFGLKFLAVGNEQWGPEYVERLEPFVKALRKAHPEIAIVGSSGPEVGGKKFDYLWPEMTRLGVDLVDEHYYSPEEWFIANADRYDKYSRKGPKVFAGEYACHTKGKKRNHFRAALLESAFMTGLERNADIVHMATYAPLFAHKKGWQWRPDMIWFDNQGLTLSSSYDVQRLYATYKGTRTLSALSNGKPLTGADCLYASAVVDDKAGEYIIKIANISPEPRQIDLTLAGVPKGKTLTPIAAERLTAAPAAGEDGHKLEQIAPTALTRQGKNAVQSIELAPESFTVLRYKY